MFNFLFHPITSFRKWYLISQTTTYIWNKGYAYSILNQHPDKLPLIEKLYELSRLYDSIWAHLANDPRVWTGVNALFEHNMLTRELVDWLLRKKKFPTNKVIAGYEAIRAYTLTPEDFFLTYNKYNHIIPILSEHAPLLKWLLEARLITGNGLNYWLSSPEELPKELLYAHNNVNLVELLHKYGLIKPGELAPQGEWKKLGSFPHSQFVILLKLESAGLLNEENMQRISSWYQDLSLLNNAYQDEAEFKRWASLLLDATTDRHLFIKAGTARFSKNLSTLHEEESLSTFWERCQDIEKQDPPNTNAYNTLANLTKLATLEHRFFPPSAPGKPNSELQIYLIDIGIQPTEARVFVR
ncbi:MAG: hypothetical protein P4L79_02500 [Legionella sp.]|uniref:hypothetical protein n=1 Tax=Legionella sp. TaxID=459 RepID=UPI002842BB6A|nr:hypothetical protein [Legionella sp.]